MKPTFKTLAFSIILTLSFSACIQEELIDESSLGENIADNSANVYTTVPCDFDLSNVQPNANIVLKCVIDLAGATVTLPDNVTLDRENGDIKNGTLIFGANSTIDSGLLNRTLTIGGRQPKVKYPTLNFIPSRWGIVEGKTTSEIAQNNNNILEKAMYKAKEMGITTFNIDKMDAYFEVSKVTSTTTNQNFYSSIEAINVPSDFTLVMTDNTHLRVYPNSNPRYALLAVRDVTNVNIIGGNLYGDRDQHDYSSGGTHEWGHVMELIAATNTVIDNVKMKNGSGDGLKIHSLGFTFQPDYAPSHNLIIKNCTFDQNRRNNISLTDGFDIIIENNSILNAGIDTSNSLGTNPKFGIDVEAVRASDGNGGYIFYEKAESILIRNNTEQGSAGGAITVHIGNYVTIEGNTTENGISYTYTYGTKIQNNTITYTSNSNSTTAISAGTSSTTTTSVYDNEISGNTITGFGVGINVKNKTTDVFNNILNNNVTGIFPNNLTDSSIFNNTISTERDSGKGIFLFNTQLNNVTIENNVVYGSQNAVKVTNVNTNPASINNTVTFKNNTLQSTRYSQMSNSIGIRFESNTFNHGFEIYDSNKIDFITNEISTPNHDGIYLRNTNTNINLIDNLINVVLNKQCIRIDPLTAPSNVSSIGNKCL